MKLSSLWRGDTEAPVSNSVSLSELVDPQGSLELIEIDDTPGQQFAIVTDKVSTGEIGSSSPSPWTSYLRAEYNPDLVGQLGLKKYNEMRKSDGSVKGTLRGVKTPVLAARFFVKPGKKFGDKKPRKVDKKAADWVWYNLQELMPATPWHQTLIEALCMLDFGYYMMEQVWDNKVVAGKLHTVLTKLAPRHPMDVIQWNYDNHGGPNSVSMATPNIMDPEVTIEIAKLVVFTHDKEAGDMMGVSVLRSAYKHWYYKSMLEKIDAIQKERHSVGIPIIKLPAGFSDDDKTAAQELGRNLRTNERAHVVLPPGWDILMLKLEGRPVDVLKSIEYHDHMIMMNVLGEFFKSSAKEADQAMFLKATRFIADIVCETFNSYCIPQMVDYNFKGAAYPKLCARRIGENNDWRDLSFAVRNFVGANVIVPDDTMEEVMREELDMPEMDSATARPVITPQAGGQADRSQHAPGQPTPPTAGPKGGAIPKQSPAGKMKQQARGTGKSNTGKPNVKQ
jgi:hypothetical protein